MPEFTLKPGIELSSPALVDGKHAFRGFPFRNSVWEFWTTFQEIPVFPWKFPFGKKKEIVFPFTFSPKFPDFGGVNSKEALTRYSITVACTLVAGKKR